MRGLVFNPENHEYRLNGVVVPSVTQICDELVDFSWVRPDALAAAQHRGTAVHLACELDDKGDLVEESVHEKIRPYLEAYRKFRNVTGFQPHVIERQVHHDGQMYAGTLDRVGMMKEDRVLIDIKTSESASPSWGLQTAAYMEAYELETMEGIDRRYALQLKRDGSYSLVPHTDQMDWPVFLSALNLYKWRMKHGIRKNT
jgi:hypothetical protein